MLYLQGQELVGATLNATSINSPTSFLWAAIWFIANSKTSAKIFYFRANLHLSTLRSSEIAKSNRIKSTVTQKCFLIYLPLICQRQLLINSFINHESLILSSLRYEKLPCNMFIKIISGSVSSGDIHHQNQNLTGKFCQKSNCRDFRSKLR